MSFQKRSLEFQKVAIGDTLNWTNYVDEEQGKIVFDSPQKAKELVQFLNNSPFQYEFIKEISLPIEGEETAIDLE